MTRFFTKDSAFYRQLLFIALPIAMQNLITTSVSMADVVMITTLGQNELSGVSQANQVGFIFMLFTFGLSSGANVMLAQFWGKQDMPSIRNTLSMTYRFLLCGGLFFTLAALLFPEQLMHIFLDAGDSPEAMAFGVRYLKIIGFSYLLMGFNNVTVMTQRAVGNVRISVIMAVTGLVTNIFLNWVLIFGNLGAPALGVEGAAIATCSARVAECIVVMTYLVAFEKKIRYKFYMVFQKVTGFFAPFRRSAVPVIINELLWGTGTALIAAVIGHMGVEFTAAYNICGVLSQLMTIFISGVGNAAAVIIGNVVGRQEYGKAKEYANTLMVLSILLGLASSALVLIVRVPVATYVNLSAVAKGYVSQITLVYAVLVILQSFSMVSLVGILRGGGDTRFVLMLDVVFMWGICIPLGAVAGLKLGFAVPAVYALLKGDELLKSSLSFWRIKSGRWINDVTRQGENGPVKS